MESTCNWSNYYHPYISQSSMSAKTLELCNLDQEWSFQENKQFEDALATMDLHSHDLFEKIAMRFPTKNVEQIRKHFQALLEDVEMIDSGSIPIPDCESSPSPDSGKEPAPMMEKTSSVHLKRRKGLPWTKEEHQSFLNGLAIYGKGDWRSISRYCVKSRSPTQVASHAQKHFLRIQKCNNNAIADATNANENPILGPPPSTSSPTYVDASMGYSPIF